MKLNFNFKGEPSKIDMKSDKGDSPALLFQVVLLALSFMKVPYSEQVRYAEKLLAETKKLRDIYE